MNPDELKKKLREAGVPVDEPWSQTSDKEAASPILERQKDLLKQLEGLLELQIEQDKARVADLLGQKARLERGGGS